MVELPNDQDFAPHLSFCIECTSQARAGAPERQEAARFEKRVNEEVAKTELRRYAVTENQKYLAVPSPTRSGKRVDRRNSLVRLIQDCSVCCV
jgi:hypothetical protein